MRTTAGTSRGFTLLELLIVLVIVALAMAMVATNFTAASTQSVLQSEARKTLALLRFTRHDAMTRNTVYFVDASRENDQLRLTPGDRIIAMPEGIRVTIEPETRTQRTRDLGIVFYPDGSSNGGRLLLSSTVGERLIAVNWLTGEVSLSAN